MKRKWMRWAGRILLTPIFLFTILMALLYVPPVQQWLQREATAYLSKETGMQIRLWRIDLRFPLNLLVRGVEVVQQPDTILLLESLNVRVQAMPLLRGEVRIDEVTLTQGTIDSAHLIEGVRVKGVLGRFFLQSRAVDPAEETAEVDRVVLEDTQIHLTMADTATTPKDTTATTPLRWKIDLHRLGLERVTLSLRQPADSLYLAASIAELSAEELRADLQEQRYDLHRLLLAGGAASYDSGTAPVAEGLDAAHIGLRDLHMAMDSLHYGGGYASGVLRELSLNERSGLSISSMTGRIFAGDSLFSIPRLHLQTPHSEIALAAHAHRKGASATDERELRASFDARIGKEDVLRFAGSLSPAFRAAYPFRPLVVRLGAEGDTRRLHLSRFSADLPGAFSLRGSGTFHHITDTLARTGSARLQMTTDKLGFLAALFADQNQGRFALPDSMQLDGEFSMRGAGYAATLGLRDQQSRVEAEARLNTATRAYEARLRVADLQLHRFLPKDSLYEVSLSASARGQGFDLMAARTTARLEASLEQLHYGRYHLSNVHLEGRLQDALATAKLSADNELLKFTADAEYYPVRSYPDGKLSISARHIDLYELGLIPQRMKRPLAFDFLGEVRRELVSAHLAGGDLDVRFHAAAGLYPLLEHSRRFAEVLQRQIGEKQLNHDELRHALPITTLSLAAGRENPLAHYLALQGISCRDASLRLSTDPEQGINGKAAVHAFKKDTLQLDTLFLNVRQDTATMRLSTGAVNGPRHPQFSFAATLTGEVRDRDAELMFEFRNGKGETGVLLGVNARPMTEEDGMAEGTVFSLLPAEPIVAFRKFRFNEQRNWVYLHTNNRLYARIDMLGEEDMRFRVESVRSDTVSLQNLDMEVQRVRLQEIAEVLPYFPRIAGLFSMETHYVQTEQSMQLSAEAVVEGLTYERQRIGDVTLGATWLPGEQGEQYFNAYLNHDRAEVLLADGKLHTTATGANNLEVTAALERFPLRVANVFIPDQMVALSGFMGGEVSITGSTEQPLVNGELALDSVSAALRQYGGHFRLDDRPVQIQDNRMTFDHFSIRTTGKNPFTIDGYVDFRDLSRPLANLTMAADNYTLIDTRRTRESLLYGKAFADFRATVRGPLDELKMRGSMSLLGNTDLSYILADSPLTVQDRLGSLVSFTSFDDDAAEAPVQAPTVSLGGLDMAMLIHIDPSVRLKVDLDMENDNRVELEGGGELSMKYTPQGDLTLTGRYTLTGGLMKYALPVVAAKEFGIESGSYIEWTGNPRNPSLNFKATDHIRASVSDGDSGGSRIVGFDVSVVVKNRMENLSFAFDVSAPEDASLQNELTAMGTEERGKQALYIMVMKTYLGTGPIGGSGTAKLNMGSALNSVLSSQINSLVGNLKNASLSVGIEDHEEAGVQRTDYSFRYSQRLFNNRFQIVIGGKVSTGEQVASDSESFIDNISLEYRLDRTGTRYVRLFYDKNYESVLEGEITEAGAGLVLRKKLDRLSELFIFKKKK